MPKVQSINQNQPADVLPNFRNLGATLRVAVLVNVIMLLEALLQAASWPVLVQHFIDSSAFVQPVLLTSLLLLNALNTLLARLTYLQGAAAVILLVVVITQAIYALGGDLYSAAWGNTSFHTWRNILQIGRAHV